MTSTSTTDRIADFVARVADHFPDLGEQERSELLEDLRQHLTELAEDDEAALELELSDPLGYAAELRRSTGLPDLDTVDGTRPSRIGQLADGLRARRDGVLQHPWTVEATEFLPELRPAWWVLRGWVLVAAAAQLTVGGPWWHHVPIPDRSILGLGLALVAVAVSVRLGRDDRDRTRTGRVTDMVARIAVVVLVLQALTSGMAVEYVEVARADEAWQPSVLRHPDGEPITNLYLFDEDGTPIEDVFVYDGVGKPVELGDLDEAGFGEIDTVFERRPDGTPMTNRYPLEQYIVQEQPEDEAIADQPERRLRTVPQVLVPDTRSTEDPTPDSTDGSSEPAPTTPTKPTSSPSPSTSPTPSPTEAATGS